MVAENIEIIRQRIAAACARVHRKPEEVTLIAVTKTFSSHDVREAMLAGVTDFGENYVQELREKQKAIAPDSIRWHFIGHLQSNKAKYIAPWIHCIQAVDGLDLAGEISRQAIAAKRIIDVMVEVNTSGEPSKFGVAPGSSAGLVREIATLKGVRVVGLMTIGRFLPDPESSRPCFRLLADLRAGIQQDGVVLPHLSMGMTNDFEVAIAEGATMVRIGTAIFGTRRKKV